MVIQSAYADGYDVCYEKAADYYAVPEVLLRIISSIESGNNPYALNIGGKGYHLKDKLKAEQLLTSNKNMDIGIMQVNSWWFKRYGYDKKLGLDPCWNIYMGAFILSYEYSRHKDIWKAVAYYHSPKENHQKKYIKKIYNEIVKWQNAGR